MVVGSFLNVVIYRLPAGVSLTEPRRSFCPHCKAQIPWYHNIPLLSWLLLRGKCAHCGAGIAFRYFAVELLTASLFLMVWMRCDGAAVWELVLPLWVLVSFLIPATFISIDRHSIPKGITLGGTIVGLLSSFIVPGLMGFTSHWKGGISSILGISTAYLIVGGWVAMGKHAFKITGPTVDVRLLGCIGAFLGVKGVFACGGAAAGFVGVVAVGLLLLGKRNAERTPFAVYLVGSVLVWVLVGPALLMQTLKAMKGC